MLLFPAFKTSLDPTRILSRPADAEVVSGTTAQLICQAECDKSLRDSFELVWKKDGHDIPLSAEENSRLVAGCCRGEQRRACLPLFRLFISALQVQFSKESYEYLMTIRSGDKQEKTPYLISLCHPYFRYAVADGMLRIMNVALSDGGIYTCVARTSLDEMNATALLTILGETRL